MKLFVKLRGNRLTGKIPLERARDGVHLIRPLMPRNLHMPDPEAVRRLLEGNIDPAEIEDDAALYEMAERIYGSEVLEEMGILAPQIGESEEAAQFAPISDDISLPDFVPMLANEKDGEDGVKVRRRRFTLLIGLLGSIGILINNFIGGGYILCSLGLADYPYICRPSEGNYKLVIEQGYTWERLHTTVAWTQPMEMSVVDASILLVFLVLVIIGVFFPKKSVHTSDVAPIDG